MFPLPFESLRDLDTEANQLFGLQTQEELSKLIWYLNQFNLVPKPVRGTGSCLFASIRRCLDCPVEYTNMHLRRQLVWFLCHNIAFFYNLLIVHVKGNYGHIRLTPQEFKAKEAAGTLTPLEIEEYNEPGPFSIVSYLESLLELSFYGEEIVVAATSMMWQLRITILASDTLQQTRVHHSNKLCNADAVLVRTRQLHYIPAGMFWSCDSSFGTVMVKYGTAMVILEPQWFLVHVTQNCFFFLSQSESLKFSMKGVRLNIFVIHCRSFPW